MHIPGENLLLPIFTNFAKKTEYDKIDDRIREV